MNNIVYNEKEYAKLLYKATIKINFITSFIGAFLLGALSFVLVNMISEKMLISIIIALIIFIIFYSFLRVILTRTIKLNNNINKIEKVEQIISDEEIIETVYLINGKFNESIYKYSDVLKVKEDNSNYYLYITSTSILVISKKKLENKDMFEKNIYNIKRGENK